MNIILNLVHGAFYTLLIGGCVTLIVLALHAALPLAIIIGAALGLLSATGIVASMVNEERIIAAHYCR